MKTLFLTAALSCNPTEMVNRTTEPFNAEDYSFLEEAKKGCKRIYKNSPCVRVFIKRSTERDYSVICSKEGGKND